MTMIGKIRRMFHREDKSVREIARLTSLSRITIRKYPKEGSATSPACMVGAIDQPTTLREYRSSTTARYSQPWAVRIYVISDTHAQFGRATSNCRFSMFSATGSVCRLSVVETNLRFHFARKPS